MADSTPHPPPEPHTQVSTTIIPPHHAFRMSGKTPAHCTFLIARKEGMAYEEFETEYRKHIPKAVPILQKYGATYYSVVCDFFFLRCTGPGPGPGLLSFALPCFVLLSFASLSRHDGDHENLGQDKTRQDKTSRTSLKLC